ncbi:hypothetical protein BJ508DRAFT_24402 [Ascobolus immersus RN42]|uniref:Exonuclease domain-containing protein n=1 Tax=Ascobolus immersus RN42 TaxID=1160509 RepID=A0A3N4HPA7_ASCIM|nr:hypothetical protein BJ508DRAFT_24402 [Ascobolus immersus RN42]
MLTVDISVSRRVCQQNSNLLCYFHPGQSSDSGICSSCNKPRFGTIGCEDRSAHSHDFTQNTFDPTPRSYHSAAERLWWPPENRIHNAIVIDCEMVELAYGKEAVVHLSAVDFVTGKTLIDSHLAIPEGERVTDWRTTYTGVTAASLAIAQQEGKVLDGIVGARQELFKHMCLRNTTLIGFSVHHDLEALRIFHPNIVDFQILYSERHGEKVGLKRSCEELLGRKIQNHGKAGNGHICMEDVMATRELVLHWIEKKGDARILSEEEKWEQFEDAYHWEQVDAEWDAMVW